jgi:hypothetical protein
MNLLQGYFTNLPVRKGADKEIVEDQQFLYSSRSYSGKEKFSYILKKL